MRAYATYLIVFLAASAYVAEFSGVCIGSFEILEDDELRSIAIDHEIGVLQRRYGPDFSGDMFSVYEERVNRPSDFLSRLILDNSTRVMIGYDYIEKSGRHLRFESFYEISNCGVVRDRANITLN